MGRFRFFHKFKQYPKGFTPHVAPMKVEVNLELQDAHAMYQILNPYYVRRRTNNGKL